MLLFYFTTHPLLPQIELGKEITKCRDTAFCAPTNNNISDHRPSEPNYPDMSKLPGQSYKSSSPDRAAYRQDC